MPALTDSIMASVPVEDAGVGSAVNDVSRELGSALGVAVLGSVINGMYRTNVADRLEGQVSDQTVELAREGLGVVAASARTLPPDAARLTVESASAAFIDAMNTGFWISAVVVGFGIVIAAAMLPNRARTIQVELGDAAGRTAGDRLGERPEREQPVDLAPSYAGGLRPSSSVDRASVS